MTVLTPTSAYARRRLIRFVGDIVVLTCALMGWFWPTLILMIVMVLIMRAYEVVVAAVAVDALLAPAAFPYGDFLATAAILVAISATMYLKRVALPVPFS